MPEHRTVADRRSLRPTPSGRTARGPGSREDGPVTSAPPVPLSSLLSTVLVPAAVFGIGQGAAVPVVALTALELGASLGEAGAIVAAAGVGQLLGDLPAGRIVSRFGERAAVVGGSVVGLVGVTLSLVAGSLWVLGLGVLLTGVANAVWGLARQSYLTEAVSVSQRARAMSALAGMSRLGFFIGPFLGAGAIYLVGTRGGFVVQLVAVLVAAVLMARMPDIVLERDRDGSSGRRIAVSLTSVVVAHGRLLRTLGSGALLLGLARAARGAILPLWADDLGISPATTSLVFGMSAAVDVLCSYPAGRLMDRYGRRVVAVPAMATLAAGYLTLPLADGVVSLTVVALVLGFGNGLSNGVIMTLAADVAPAATRAEFFAAWRLTHDTGMLAGPLVVAGIALVAPLGVAAVTVGGLTALGAGVLWTYIPVFAPFRRPREEPTS